MANTADALRTALDLHNAGDLQQAEQIYRQVLAAQPHHAGALHLLGLIALQVGKYEAAIELIGAAVGIDPRQAQFHAHLADAYGNLGQWSEAVESYRRAIGIAPDFFAAHDSLGKMFRMQNNLVEAEASHREAIRLRPRSAMSHFNLGVVLQARGQIDSARDSYQQALGLDPTFAEVHFNLACIFQEQRSFSAAATAYQEALRLKPDYLDALNNYGVLAQDMGDLDGAGKCFERIVRLRPDWAMGHYNLANVHKLRRMRREAIACYLETVRLAPTYAAAYHNLAICHSEMDQADPAITYCQKGLEHEPNSAALCDSMGFALHTQGRGEEAIAWYRKAVALAPDDARRHANLLYALNYVPPIDPAALFSEHLVWARRHAEPLTALAAPHTNDRAPDRRLRIGYVSAHFRRHAVNYFTQPILTAHDHARFEIFCYSDVLAVDDVTAHLQSLVDQWRDVGPKSDEELAQLVRDDRIDILVDLAGHIGGSRLLVFARKPAPIQVTYIGYQNTTGMSAMDYRLTDERADPPGKTDPFYTEQLIRLPRSFFCYRPSDDSPPITSLPARAAGRVTFGCFNTFKKTTPQVIAAWLQILSRVDDSQLLILATGGGYVERHLHELAQRQRIDPRRIKFFDRRANRDYQELLQQADIALDPFPFNGHTTTCDLIWMGVPVVMLEGETYASRFGGSVLANVGLEDLIAGTVEQYVEIAVKLAGDLERLERLRTELRQRMADSALLDFEGFTRNLELSYRQMWLKWCASSASD
jgi:protein O-GlcNAc transferase